VDIGARFSQKGSETAFLTDAGRITIRIAGNSTDRLNEDMGRWYERLPKRPGGLFVAP